jgi:hypothetical protein
MPLGWNLAQRPTHSNARPSPWPRHSCAHGGRWRRYHGGGGARLGAGASMAEGSPAGQVGGGGSSPELLADGKGGKTRRRRRSPMRWVLRWPVVSCVGVGKRWKFRRRCTRRKRRQGGARGSAHRGGGHDGGGERVVRGGSRLRSKTRRCGDAGEAAA